jgi:hypothetical protein
LDRGADANAMDNRGRTPLFYACRSVDEGAIALLLSYGADITLKTLPRPWEQIIEGSVYNEFILNKEKQKGDQNDKLKKKTKKSSSDSTTTSTSQPATSPNKSMGDYNAALSPSSSSQPTKVLKKKKFDDFKIEKNNNFELRSGGKHRALGNDFGTIRGNGCGTCVLAARPEDRNEVYNMLAAGCDESEVRAMHASLLSRFLPFFPCH